MPSMIPSALRSRSKVKADSARQPLISFKKLRRRSTHKTSTQSTEASIKDANLAPSSAIQAPETSAVAERQPGKELEVRSPEVASAAPALAPLDLTLTTQDLIRPRDELKQSIEAFLLDQRSPHTRRAYGKDLKRFVQFLLQRRMDRGIERLDRSVIIAYKESLLREELEHTTVDRHLATLRSFFRWMVDDGRIQRSPAEGVRFLKPRRLSTTIGFTDEEVRRILAMPETHTRTGAMHQAILTVLFYCGLRRSELCSLRTTNLGTERGHAVMRLRGKGNAERLIVLVPRVWQALKHYFRITGKDPRQDQPIFTPVRNNRTGVSDKPLDPSMIFYIVVKYSRLAGVVNRVSPHSCRATAISNARDHQVADRAIQEFAGWASPDMITRYDKRRSSIEKSAAKAIAYGDEPKTPPGFGSTDVEGVQSPEPAGTSATQTVPVL